MQITPTGNKRDIAARFSAAADRYDDLANVQYAIAEHALSRLGDDHCASTLDIGCGTGRITSLLSTRGLSVCGMDLAPGMIALAKRAYPDITFLQGDAESLPWQDSCFDQVFSSMALQWCDAPERAISEVFRVLKPAGRAELAIMVEGSLPELRLASQRAHIALSLNQLAPTQRWLSAVYQHRWQNIDHQILSYRDSHSDIVALLTSIKGVGASSATRNQSRRPLTRSRLMALEEAFKGRNTQLLTNTYEVLHISMEKGA